MQKIIRYVVIAFGVILWLIVAFVNIPSYFAEGQNPLTAFISLGLFGLWNILPHIFYFLITRRIKSLIKLLIPAVLLCASQLFFIITYLTSLSSTAGLIFIFAPFYEFIVLGIGFVLNFFISKIKSK